MNFCKDYEIFPSLMSKAKLNSFFIAISQYSQIGNENNILIEQSLFIDLLSLIALDIIYPQPEPNSIEKILVLMEKISQSEGANNKIFDTKEFLQDFKKFYPQYFQNKNKKNNTFMDLIYSDNEN